MDSDSAIPPDLSSFFWILIVLWFVTAGFRWMLFRKAAEPGWAALIPVYNYVVLLRIAGRPPWMLLPLVAALPLGLILLGLALAERFEKPIWTGLVAGLIPCVGTPLLLMDFKGRS